MLLFGLSDQSSPGLPKMPTVKEVLVGGAVGVGGAVAMTVGAPIVLGAAGFGTGGIVAGSLAAKAMSFAMTQGVGMAAVSLAQSAGAAGFSAATAACAGGASTGAYVLVKGLLKKKAGTGSSGSGGDSKKDDGGGDRGEPGTGDGPGNSAKSSSGGLGTDEKISRKCSKPKRATADDNGEDVFEDAEENFTSSTEMRRSSERRYSV